VTHKPKKNLEKIIVVGLAILLATIFYLGPKTELAASAVPRFKYLAIVVEENHSFEDVIGNKDVPYFNSLSERYGLATNYYANQTGSISDYFWFTPGQPLTSNNTTTEIFTVDNIFRKIIAAGLTWKTYAQSIPSVGFLNYNGSTYLKRHNPATYFSDTTTKDQRSNIVPSEKLKSDLSLHKLPNYILIVPDAKNDGHDGTLKQLDDWLVLNVKPLIDDEEFSRDGLLIITFDEGSENDNRHGGGRVATLLVSPKVKSSYKSDIFFQHPSILKTSCEVFGFSDCPASSNSAPSFSDFFN